MNFSEFVNSMLSQMSYQAPLLLVCLIGFVISFTYLQQNPRPAKWTMLATGILLLASMGTMLAHTLLANRAMGGDRNVAQDVSLLRIIDIVGICLRAGGVGLLITAAFSDRAGRPVMAQMTNIPPVQNINPGNRFPS